MGTVPINAPDFTRSRARRFKCDLLTIGWEAGSQLFLARGNKRSGGRLRAFRRQSNKGFNGANTCIIDRVCVDQPVTLRRYRQTKALSAEMGRDSMRGGFEKVIFHSYVCRAVRIEWRALPCRRASTATGRPIIERQPLGFSACLQFFRKIEEVNARRWYSDLQSSASRMSPMPLLRYITPNAEQSFTGKQFRIYEKSYFRVYLSRSGFRLTDTQGRSYSLRSAAQDQIVNVVSTISTLWSKPKLVGRLSFAEWSPANHLRHSRLLDLRNDKDPHQVRNEIWSGWC